MTRKPLRYLLPLLLIALGVLTLSGCVFVPTFQTTINNTTNVEKKVGNARSKKPIRMNESSQQDIEAILGKPAAVALDGKHVLYHWDIRHGVWVMPLCFHVGYDDGRAWAEFEYDQDHVLRAAKFTRGKTRWPYPPIFGDFGDQRNVPSEWQERYPQPPPTDVHIYDKPSPPTKADEPLHLSR